MEFHGNCIFHRIQWKTFSMEFHGKHSMEFHAQYQTEFHGIPWKKFHGIPWNSMGLFYTGNAGCYHSSRTLLACREISASTGVKVVRVDFSDPQGGKGAADRLAASCKGHIRAFINEGNDVCTANDLEKALLSHGGLEGVRVVCLDTINETADDSQTITGITKLNNFEFSSDESITCWRAYSVGRGKTIKPEKVLSGKYVDYS